MADLFDGPVEPNEKPACQKGNNLTVRRVEDADAGAEKVVDCDLCVQDSPVYNFGSVCCRVRFVIGEPRLEVRRMWIDRWKKRDGEMGTAVEREVMARWVKGKSQCCK